MLSYVRSFCEANFYLYVDTITELTSWFFSLDDINYARWLSIHVRDMASLQEKHPDIAAEFDNGHFTVKKTFHKFSSMAIDQVYKQITVLLKVMGELYAFHKTLIFYVDGWWLAQSWQE